MAAQRSLMNSLGGGVGSRLGSGNRLMRAFQQNTQPVAGIKSHEQGLSHALQELLRGVSVGRDDASRTQTMEAIQSALVEDPATVTESKGAFEFTGAEEGGEGDETEITSANPNRRSLMQRLTEAGDGMSGNPYMQKFQQSLIPTRLAANLAATIAATKRREELTDMETKRVNALALKKAPGSSSGFSDLSSPEKNYEKRVELVAKYGKNSEQVRVFDSYVRARKIVDLGATQVQVDPANPQVPIPIAANTIPPEKTPAHAAQVASAKAQGAATGGELGDAKARLAAMTASLPRLQQAVTTLKTLGAKATYTTAGKAANEAARELGMQPGEGATARAEYIARVKNNILPLLRQTFGAAFTAAEGDSLLATLGDPDMHPEEKNRVLTAFIDGKEKDIRALQRQVKAGSGGAKKVIQPPAGFTVVP